jgi:glycine/D-amino acid oxidase-like deaminating enzyme
MKIGCDVAVLGGGILGLGIAALAARRGYRVVVIRLHDRGRPRADTLRNQGWLQSGLIYIDHFGSNRRRGRVVAGQMYAAGLGMLHDLGLPPPDPSERGMLRTRTQDEGKRLEEDAEVLRIKGVKRLGERFARGRLGAIYETGVYYSIPDTRFPEATVLERLRKIAQTEGADILQLAKPAILASDANSGSGVRIACEDGREIVSKATVAAAGAGNCPLLQGLAIEPFLRIKQTPLLVLHESLSNTVPIFADRDRGFSFVHHPPDGPILPNGALVVGTKVDRVVEFHSPDDRRITLEDRQKFATFLPPILQARIPAGRFTAGYEVIPEENLDRKYFEPWFDWVEGFPALLHAMPGRATLGLFVARQVLDELVLRIGRPNGRNPSTGELATGWVDPILMHYDPAYDFNDSD